MSDDLDALRGRAAALVRAASAATCRGGGPRDPYAILVCEVMLQQTQVARVVPRYLAWLERWPTAAALAAASRAEVLAAWVGLGYNRRALRCTRRARGRSRATAGRADLRALPGVGPYTAAAVASFAFGAQVARGRHERAARRRRLGRGTPERAASPPGRAASGTRRRWSSARPSARARRAALRRLPGRGVVRVGRASGRRRRARARRGRALRGHQPLGPRPRRRGAGGGGGAAGGHRAGAARAGAGRALVRDGLVRRVERRPRARLSGRGARSSIHRTQGLPGRPPRLRAGGGRPPPRPRSPTRSRSCSAGAAAPGAALAGADERAGARDHRGGRGERGRHPRGRDRRGARARRAGRRGGRRAARAHRRARARADEHARRAARRRRAAAGGARRDLARAPCGWSRPRAARRPRRSPRRLGAGRRRLGATAAGGAASRSRRRSRRSRRSAPRSRSRRRRAEHGRASARGSCAFEWASTARVARGDRAPSRRALRPATIAPRCSSDVYATACEA